METFTAVDGTMYAIGTADADVGLGIRVERATAGDYASWLKRSFDRHFSVDRQRWIKLMGRPAGEVVRNPGAAYLYQHLGARLEAGDLVLRQLPFDAPPPRPTLLDMTRAAAARVQDTQAAPTASADDTSEFAGASDTPVAVDDAGDQRVGDPVAPASGEEVLILEDFTVAGPMPLVWQRRYRSGNCDRDLGFGAGWSLDCLRAIWLEEDGVRVLDDQGRVVRFAPLKPGEIGWQVSAGMRLEYKHDSRMVLTEKDGTAWRFATRDNHLWHPVSVQNLRGQQWRFHYDRSYRLHQIEVAPQRHLELTWKQTTPQSRHRLVQVLLCQNDQLTVLASYDYSETGDLVTSDSHHGRERYQYQGHLLIRRELPTGYGFSFRWHGQGPSARCIHSRGDDGHHEFRFDYQPDKFQTSVTDAFGNTQVFHYDQHGRITARQEPDGATAQWQYDSQSGLMTAYRLPDGRTTYYGYDAWGRKVLEQQPDGRQHRWQYNALGFCVAEQTPDGLTTRRKFDSTGRLLRETRPDGSQWHYQYDANGWMTKATSDTGEVRRLGYSANGEVLADEHQGNLHRYAFDTQGRVAGVLRQDLVTEYDYDGAKLLAVHQYPEQAPDQRRSRQYGYNDSGLLTRYTNAVGNTHHYDYDKLARPIAYRRPDGHRVQYDYDLAERLTRVTRADGHQWQLGWNARGEVNRCKAPDGRDIHFHYNAAGDIIRREHPGVWVQTLERDDGGRVTTQTSQGRDRAPVTRHYQYDNHGRRSHATCADRRLRWTWTEHGQIAEHHQDQHRIGYRYASGNRLEAITLPDGTEVTYEYDKHGHWTRLLINGQPAIRRTLDSQGRETERQAGHNQQTQIHDRYGCLIKRRWQGQTPATRRYRWDAESRVEAVIDSQTGDTYYERDQQGQLIKENDTQYHYDLGGNRIPDGGKVEQDRLLATRNDKRDYDALGAEIRVTGKTTGLSNSQTRKFDAEGQLIEVKKPGLHVTYGYDALGRRAWRKSEAGTTTYVWHNDVLLGEQNPEGQWQWYIRDPQTDAPLLTIANGERFFYELDHRMMPLRLWSEAGNLVWQGNADAWGRVRAEQAETPIHQPLRLPGQFEDELTGIFQNRFRDYSPDSGRYLSPDPLGLQGGLSSYRYTKNPIDYVDPLGLNGCDVSGVTPEQAALGEEAPIGNDGPAFQNIELAGAAALARAPAPVPTPTTTTVTRVVTGAAANDAVYAVERSLLSRVMPVLGSVGTFVTGMLYSPSLGGGVDRVVGPDGTVYQKPGSERIFNATGPDGATWHTDNPQEDMEYRIWRANGGDGSLQEWLAEGKPKDVLSPSPGSFDFGSTQSVSFDEFCDSVEEFSSRGEGAQNAFSMFRNEQWSELESAFNEQGINGGWPPNRGAISSTEISLNPGQKIDRYGGFFDSKSGEFRDLGTFSAPADVPFENRALPASVLDKPYKKYEVLKEIPNVKAGKTIPWFGQPGQGMQYELPLPVEELVNDGYLREIN